MGGGERIDAVWRDVHRGRVWRAQACRIVEETPEHAALWMPRGSLAMLPVDDTGARIRIPGEAWELEPISSKRDATLPRPGGSPALDLPLLQARRRIRALVRQLRAAPAPDAGRLRHLRPQARSDRDARRDLPLEGRGRARAGRGARVARRRGGPGGGLHACSRSGRSRPAGRTGDPTRPGRSRSCRKAGTGSEAARPARCLRRVGAALGRLGRARPGGPGGRRGVEGDARAGAPLRRRRLAPRDALHRP